MPRPPAKVARLAGAVQRYADEALFCRVVSLDEIRENDHNLNLTRYVQTDPPPPPIAIGAPPSAALYVAVAVVVSVAAPSPTA